MAKKKKEKMRIPKSVKIYIRREKARIRKSRVGLEEQKKMFDELYQDLGFTHEN